MFCKNAKCPCWVQQWLYSAGVSFRGQTVGVDARLNECRALYLCRSSHVHVCGAYICLPGASVLNSLSMCDESSGWEKSSTVHGLSWPLTKWILKRLSICQGLQFVFCSAPISLPYLFGFVSPSLYLPLCLSLYLVLYSLLILNRHAECERCSKRVRQIKKREHPPLIRLSS